MLEQLCSNSLCCNMFDMLILTIWPLKTSRLANQALGYVKRLHAFYPFLRSNTWTRWINLLKIWADVPSTAPASCAHNEVLRARISILHIDDASQNSMHDLNFWSDVSPDYCKPLWHCYGIWSSKAILGFVATYPNRNVCKVWFPLTRFWLRTLTHVNFNHVNKTEAE